VRHEASRAARADPPPSVRESCVPGGTCRTSRGCDYVDINPVVEGVWAQIGDQPELVLMDNKVLASPMLAKIVTDVCSL
jgi:hypothetical protein